MELIMNVSQFNYEHDCAMQRDIPIYYDAFRIDGGDENDSIEAFIRYTITEIERGIHVPRSKDGKSYYQRYNESWYLHVE